MLLCCLVTYTVYVVTVACCSLLRHCSCFVKALVVGQNGVKGRGQNGVKPRFAPIVRALRHLIFRFLLSIIIIICYVCVISRLCSFKTVFTPEEEQELVKYIKKMEGMLFGLSPMDLRRLAFELGEINEKDHPFDKELGTAGYDWYKGFMDRHSHELSLRKAGATSAARAMGFNKVSAGAFFTLLENVVDQTKLGVDRIWNCDETGISSVQKSLSKVISTKGKKQVGSMT